MAPTDPIPHDRVISRRRFLVLTAKGSALVAAGTTILRKELLDPARAYAATTPVVGPTVLLVRPEDQLRLTFELLNLDLDPATSTLVAVDAADPFTGIVIGFGSQHTAEAPIATGDQVPTGGADHRGAGDTRVVLRVPPGTAYSRDALLGFAGYALVLDGRADPASGTSPTGEPAADVTALELDESLVFSPTPDGRFVAATAPVTRGDVTELWRARLATVDSLGTLSEPKDPGPNLVPTQLRAIWSREGDPPFDRPLDEPTRSLLVGATTGPTGVPLTVSRLWLTSAGAFTDLAGVCSTGLLASFHQRSATGRDVVVEVVERGYLAPFGHEAAITRVTQRDLRIDDGGGVTDVLVQDDYLVVATPTRVYDVRSTQPDYMPHAGRAFPFTTVTVTGVGAGPVGKAPVTLADGSGIGLDRAWVVTSDGADLQLTYDAVDKGGRSGITFALPAVFVTEGSAYTVQDEVNGQTTVLGRLATYFAEAPDARRLVELGGQPITWAEAPDTGARGTAGSLLATARARLTLDRPDLGTADPGAVRDDLAARRLPAFFPRVVTAYVSSDAVSAMLGGTTGEVEVGWADRWLTGGTTEANPDLGFFTLVATDASLSRTGTGQGLLSPSFALDTFSQSLGAGSEMRTSGPGTVGWDPATALGTGASILGNILLTELIDELNVALDSIDGEKGLPAIEIVEHLPTSIDTVLTWSPKLKPWPANDPVFLTTDVIDPGIFDAPTTATLELTYVMPIDATSEAGFDVDLGIDNFGLRLPPGRSALELYFSTLHYVDPHDGPDDLRSELADWRFVDVLEWLDPVRQFVMTVLDLFDLDVDDAGVHLDVDVPIPSFSIGVVGVTNVSIGFALDIPNDGKTSIGFNLSNRDDPFTVSVFGFGGTGSLELELVADDLVFLEASMAATYVLGVSFLLGSASLSASLGLDVLYERPEVTLTAFVELVGNASLLGIVNVTGKVTVSLAYDLTTKVLHGSAKLVGEVDTLFGKSETSTEAVIDVPLGDRATSLRSASQSRLAMALAGPAHPTLSFADRFSQDEWTTYCDAFS